MKAIGDQHLLKLNEPEEFHLDPYENAKTYKAKMNKWHDARIANRQFEPGIKVLLYNSCLRLMPGKLHSKWSGPFTITQVFSFGVV